jgi:hypothetical protein
MNRIASALACVSLFGFELIATAEPVSVGDAILTLSASQATASFGGAIAATGDVDGDGIDDIVVFGADQDDSSCEQPPCSVRTLFQFSGATGNLIKIEQPFPRTSILIGIYDVDGDGVRDFLSSEGGSLPSKSFIYSGATLQRLHSFDGGAAAAMIDDIDGDGVDEIVTGHRGSTNNPGRVHVYSGTTRTVLHKFVGESNDDWFGHAVAGVSDVNGDGIGDIFVGAPRDDTAGSNAGRVYVFSGLTGQLLFTLEGENPNDEFGSAVHQFEDINNDGVGDLIIGAPFFDGAASGSGRIYIFSGVDGALLQSHIGANYNGRLGSVIHGGGDLNGDSIPDVLVSEPGNIYSDFGGTVYVLGGVDGHIVTTFYSLIGGGEFGSSLATINDLNGDGVVDVLVGAPSHEVPDDAAEGRVFLFAQFVFATADLNEDRFVNGTDIAILLSAWGQTGFPAGDINGDGVINGADLAILLASWTG